MQTIQFELSEEMSSFLDQVCLSSSQVRQSVLREMVAKYLEDVEDTADAIRILQANEPRISLAEVEQKYGLAN